MKKLPLIIVSFLMLFCGAFACNKGDAPKDGDTTPKASNSIILSGFSGDEELRTFLYTDFYKAATNTDKTYVSEGETSGKFTIASKTAHPQFLLFTDTKFNSKKDFTDVRAITFDAFNPSDEERTVTLSFTSRKGGSGTSRSTYTEREYTLKKGKNSLTYIIDREVASQVCDMKNVEHLTLKFGSADADPYDVYLDNLRAHLTDEPVNIKEKEYKENELIFFDDPVDRYFVSATTVMAPVSMSAAISICRNPKYIKSGNGSLQLDLPIAENPGGIYSPGIIIQGEVIDRLDFSEYDEFKFSVLGNGKTLRGNITVRVTDSDGVRVPNVTHLRKELNDENWQLSIAGNVWYTLTVKISDLVASGLNTEKIKSIEIFHYNLTAEPAYSLFYDEFVLVKK